MFDSLTVRNPWIYAAATLALVGCGKSETPPPPEPAPVAAPAEAPAAAPAPAAVPAPAAPAPNAVVENADGTVSVFLESVGETMGYNVSELTIPAGKKVTVTLKNNATAAVMKHNFVLVTKGKADEIGIAALQAGEAKGYLPDSPAILAHTSMSEPGSTVTVTFDAPPAGEYQYLCTFPGHYLLMRGKLIVK